MFVTIYSATIVLCIRTYVTPVYPSYIYTDFA